MRLNSLDPHEQPEINLNHFSNELDILALREGIRSIDGILMNGDGMRDIIAEDYPWFMPGHSDEEMDRVILDRSQTFSRDVSANRAHGLCKRTVDQIVVTRQDCRRIFDRRL